MLESLFKAVLVEEGNDIGDETLLSLWTKTKKRLKMFRHYEDLSSKAKTSLLKLNSSLNQIVQSIAEMRNMFGTGHGKTGAVELHRTEAKLVVNAGMTVAIYVAEVWRKGREGSE